MVANPNLAGRAASKLFRQVTPTGPVSVLPGILAVFGTPANEIISNSNAISVDTLSLTNLPGLVLTTGARQFFSGVGRMSTSFASTGALAYSASFGNTTINGPSGVSGPGAGIEGTVGNIDVIAQTDHNLDALLLANDRVNLITDDQLVSSTALYSTGTSH